MAGGSFRNVGFNNSAGDDDWVGGGGGGFRGGGGGGGGGVSAPRAVFKSKWWASKIVIS